MVSKIVIIMRQLEDSMINNALLESTTLQAGNFDTAIWKNLVERIGTLFNFTEEDKNKLSINKLAQLIGAIPFLAKCDEPYRISLTNLSITYLASHSAGKDVFSHNFTDNQNLFTRLDPINNFSTGNKEIIARGMDLLALVMLSDHKKDQEKDLIHKKYNPVSSGIWNYDLEVQKIQRRLEAFDCPEMDEILSFKEAKAFWWEYL